MRDAEDCTDTVALTSALSDPYERLYPEIFRNDSPIAQGSDTSLAEMDRLRPHLHWKYVRPPRWKGSTAEINLYKLYTDRSAQ